jgi:hypothetical protein
MHTENYIREKTGLLLVDPYNDFLSPAGKLWPQAKGRDPTCCRVASQIGYPQSPDLTNLCKTKPTKTETRKEDK